MGNKQISIALEKMRKMPGKITTDNQFKTLNGVVANDNISGIALAA